jgi:hypothetical protein
MGHTLHHQGLNLDAELLRRAGTGREGDGSAAGEDGEGRDPL